jgi:hypothetical protein
LVSVLRGVQSNAENQSSGAAELTWDAVNAELRPYGAPGVRYDQFDKRWQEEEGLPPEHQILHNLVDRYDGHGLVLKGPKPELNVGTPKDNDQVGKMAKRATAKAMK